MASAIRQENFNGRKATVTLMNADFTLQPDESKAKLVKILFEDGDCVFATPSPKIVVAEQEHWVTVDGRRILIGGNQPWQKTKEQHAGESPFKNIGDREPTEAESEAFLARLHKEKEWESSTKGAISAGKLTPEEAVERGLYRGDAKEFVPLPDKLYHVTVAADKVDAEGLKTRDEQGVSSGAGLGGGESNTISLTTDPKIATGILDGIREAHQVLNGKITVDDMLEQARNGTDAQKPWAGELEKYYENNEGGMDRVTRGITKESGWPVYPSEKPGWTPVKSSEMTYTDGPPRYTVWERPLTADERSEQVFSLYRAWSLFREQAGGKYDPFFGFNDRAALKAVKPENIAMYEVKPVPGARGVKQAGEEEYRIHSGKAVTLKRL